MTINRHMLTINELYDPENKEFAEQMTYAWACPFCGESGVCTWEMEWCSRCARKVDRSPRNLNTTHGQMEH